MTHRNQPLVIDLVICTYNNASLLQEVLDAIAQQRVSPDVDWGVLVVNNNCTDETPAIVEQYIKSGQIPNLRMVQEPVQGLTPARVCGVNNTTANWIAFVDDDCVLRKDWVEQAARFAASHLDCGAFGGRVVLTWESPPPPFVLKYGYSFAEQEHGMTVQQRDCLVGAGMVVSRNALFACHWNSRQLMTDRIGKKLISGGDVEMALRIRSAGYLLWYTPDCELKHIIPQRRISETYLKAMNFGLGKCQLHADGMLWAGSYPDWLLASVLKTVRSSIDILRQALEAAMGRVEPVEVAINWSFVRGRWAGIVQLLQMDREQRRILLGCAKVC